MTLETLVNDYKAKTSRSRQMYEEAVRVMPGGNSRTTTFFDPYPFYITRGQGARIWDADGAERLDFNGNYTSLILGHAPPSVVEAVPETVLKHTVVLPWNDIDACVKILEKQGGDIAALIVDPLMANAGLLVPQPGFLERLREVTERLGIVLIFDEVIAFRVARGGAQ